MRQRWMILVPVLGLAGTAAPARADCADGCSIYAPNVYSDWYSRKESCLLQCAFRPPKISHGALAYGARSTAWGFSYGQDSAAAADRVALEGCRPNGDDCKVVYDFYNTCAALAAVESKGVYATAYAASRGAAENAAMEACTRQYGNACEVEVSACSFP